jgi:hypothetical protein
MAQDSLFIPFGNYDEADRLTVSYVPADEYLVRIKSVDPITVKQGANEGKPGIRVWMEIIEGKYAGSLLVDRFYVIDTALWRFSWFLRTVGIKVTKRDMTLPYKQLAGRTLRVKVVEGEPYEGSPRNEIKAFNPAPKTESAPAEEFAAADVADSWNESPKTEPIDPARADTLLSGPAYDAEDPWTTSSPVTL